MKVRRGGDMRLVKKRLVMLALVCTTYYPPLSIAEGDNTGVLLRQVVEESLSAFQQEDMLRSLQYVHTKSPEYEQMKQRLTQHFRDHDLRAELVDYSYIGHEREFAAARVKLKTTRLAGEPFQNNVTDLIFIFDQEAGQWKYWGSIVLGTEFIN
jgi:hypothetical protein